MPTYKNNTTERIVSQDIIFDPDQTKTSSKILVEEVISFDVLAGAFQVGEVITGGTSGATGTVLRFDSEDKILDLIKRDATAYGPVKDADAVPPVTGETLTGGTSGATGELLSAKAELTRTLVTPDFKDVLRTDVTSSADAEVEEVLIDVDKAKAIVVDCTAVEYALSLNRVENVVHEGLAAAASAMLIETDGETRLVFLTQVGAGAGAGTILQFSSVEQAYRYLG